MPAYIPIRDSSHQNSKEITKVDKPLPELKSWDLIKLGISRFKATLERQLPKLPEWMNFSGWRTIVICGAGLSVAILVVNIIVLAWANQRPKDPQTGAAIIYTGSSSSAQNVFRWTHLMINILSTLLLGCSNGALQCLTAPTREEASYGCRPRTIED